MQTTLCEIRIRNFKLFDQAGITIEPRRITVFIGVNGSGKSSVFQALLLLKQSLGQDQLQLGGQILALGTLRDILHSQEITRTLAIKLKVKFRDFALDLPVSPDLPQEGFYTYEAEFVEGRVDANRGAIGGQNCVPALSGVWERGHEFVQPSRLLIEGGIQVSLSSSPNVGVPMRTAGMSWSGEDLQAKANVASLKLRQLFSVPETLLRRTFLVPPIRGFDRIKYATLDGIPLEDLTAAGGPEEQARSTVNLLAYEPQFTEEVSEWLQRILPSSQPRRLRTRLATGSTITGESARGPISINLVNEAFGANQLVSPLLWLARSPVGSVVGIEEPEIHLHPKAQATLSEVFVAAASRDQKQIVLTTHSEHILMGLLTAVAERRLAPDDLAVYEFRREADIARVERLDVNENGQVAGGLSGFLEADLNEIGALLATRFPTTKA